jgi:3',5'-nucleoside bisphosphate phosphatase
MAKQIDAGLLEYRAELHVHTVLSPCAGVEMIPPLIVRTALQHQINIIAITDHNASANVAAVQKAARDTLLTVIPGMELQTREEVHLLCLFAICEQLYEFQEIVNKNFPLIQNDPDYFGEQFVVDDTGDFIKREERLLLLSCELDFEAAVNLVKDFGGLAIPAHVDRKAFGLYANLGFIPPDSQIDAVEISRHITPDEAHRYYPDLSGKTLLQGGDVHYLDDFLGNNLFLLKEPSFTEISYALHGIEGRSVRQLNKSIDNQPVDV